MSRIHRVLGPAGPGTVEAQDLDGGRHAVSLLAFDGTAPAPGDWILVHSGYALGRVDAAEAESVLALWRGAEDALGDRAGIDDGTPAADGPAGRDDGRRPAGGPAGRGGRRDGR